MVYLSFLKFRLAKKLDKQAKNRYFNNNFTEFQHNVLVILNIFVGKRSLEPPPHLAATDLNRQVEDVFTVLKFIFSTQRNKTIRSFKIVLEL